MWNLIVIIPDHCLSIHVAVQVIISAIQMSVEFSI